MAIVFTCRQSYREAGLLWYAEPEFILDCCPVMLQEWIEAIGKREHLHYPSRQGWYDIRLFGANQSNEAV
jgi:hypothetical protein